MGHHRLVALALIASLCFAGSASAKRSPTKAETTALKAAFTGYVAMPNSPAARDNRIVSESVSTRDPRYAALKLDSKTAGPSTMVLHESLSTWWVVGFGSSLGCDTAPASVLTDLGVPCSPPAGVAWIDTCGPLVSAPSELVISCADANYELTKLHWHGWGSSSASATAVASANDCTPNCAAGHFHSYAASVTAGKLGTCGAARYYARLVVSYKGSRPAGISARTTYPLRC